VNAGPGSAAINPYLELSRGDWAARAKALEQPLTEAELAQIRSLGDVLDLQEVTDIYLPLSQLLSIYVDQFQRLHSATIDFFGKKSAKTPFIIGIAGSVAVGKSTVSRLLRELLQRWPSTPKVELVTTDGFLLPNSELERRGIMNRKGFPESYDRAGLLNFLGAIKSGEAVSKAPVYSHLAYDIVSGQFQTVSQPDVLILEGLNVLQPPLPGQELALSDFFDFTIYVDADASHIETWFLDRFRKLWSSAFTNPESYFHPLTRELDEPAALERARGIWREINLPNLELNILPTRARATLVISKDANHRVNRVLLRRL
jgi:type I pantothenate kinase